MKRRDFLMAGLLAPVLVPDIGAGENVMCVEWKENPVTLCAKLQFTNGNEVIHIPAYLITDLGEKYSPHNKLVRLADGSHSIFDKELGPIISFRTASKLSGLTLDPGFVYLRVHKSSLL